MHIHFGEEARHECPTLASDDANRDGRLNTVEGQPAYGPIVVSLTTTGDTTPTSALALGRFPTSTGGKLNYSRDYIEFTDVADAGEDNGPATAKQIADAVRAGQGVVVIHGNDYNDYNDMYDFSVGESELDPTLPAEGTDPTACGVLKQDSR